MSIISKETWEKFTQDEKRDLQELYVELAKTPKVEREKIEVLNDIFPEEALQPQPLTYDDVARELYNSSAGTFGIPERDFSKKSDVKPWDYFGVYSKEAQQKVIAIIKLLNVAKFLNGDWKPDWENNDRKWYIFLNEDNQICFGCLHKQRGMDVYFCTEDLAKQAIQILGEDTVRLALTTEH